MSLHWHWTPVPTWLVKVDWWHFTVLRRPRCIFHHKKNTFSEITTRKFSGLGFIWRFQNIDLVTLVRVTFLSRQILSFYNPPTKLRECNVFSHVCLLVSVFRRTGEVGCLCNHYPWCNEPHHEGTPLYTALALLCRVPWHTPLYRALPLCMGPSPPC